MTSGYDVAPGPMISSPNNSRIKKLVGLRKRRERDETGLCLVEGYAELRLAVDCRAEPETVFYCPDLIADLTQLQLVDDVSSRGAEVVRVTRRAFAKASMRDSPDGWLGVVPTPERELASLSLGEQPLVLVCESIEKPGNLGALLRTADAAGVDAVISASPATDWGNPNVVRASKGSVFAVPVASSTSANAAAWLQHRGLQVAAADPQAVQLVSDLDLARPTAVVVGAEHAGLSSQWRSPGVQLARLPMLGRIDSLNVSTAAAAILYEAVRQRTVPH